MEWLQLTVNVSKEQADQLSDRLIDHGAVSITFAEDIAQPIYQADTEDTPLWDNTNLIALFPANYDPKLLQTVIDTQKSSWQVIAEQDWATKWQEHLEPMQFGDHLWVCPSWCKIPDPTATNISLDPEMAFGTGTHATTALCLNWIAENIKLEQTVIDFGCGSGILAIAAAKLGAKAVYAVDIDPIAIEVCTRNAIKNGVDIITHLPNSQADVLIANILAKPLLELADQFAALIKPGGTVVLSGILSEQSETIQAHYSSWFRDFSIQQQDEWIRLTATRKI